MGFDTEIFEEWIINKVELPTSVSINLSAQFGLFTLNGRFKRSSNKFSSISIEDYVAKDRLVKLVLDSKCKKELMKYCDLFSISAATLFPGIDGAVKSTKEKLQIIQSTRSDNVSPTDRLKISKI